MKISEGYYSFKYLEHVCKFITYTILLQKWNTGRGYAPTYINKIAMNTSNH